MTIVRWIFAALVVGIIGFAGSQALKPRPEPPLKVELTKAVKTSLTRTVSGAGKLEPVKKINVSSNITGTLMDLAVGIGSHVKKGQYLGQIDTSRYRATVDQQTASSDAAWADVTREEANLQHLRDEAARAEKLFASKVSNQGELEQARSAVKVAEAQLLANKGRARVSTAGLREAKNSLSWATLRSPVDGTVFSANHRVGERIRGSDFSEDVVLVIGTLDRMDVRIEVGEHDVVHMNPGQKARIEIDALPDVQIEGEVIDNGRDAIVKNPGTDNEVTSYPVWITVGKVPENALPGMSAQVTVFTETRNQVIAVPIQAVTVRAPEGPGGKGGPGGPAMPAATAPPAGGAPAGGPQGSKLEKVVFVHKPGTGGPGPGGAGKVEKRVVKTGLSSDRMVEITSGLNEGEEIVEGPYRLLARELHEGSLVEAEKKPDGGKDKGAAGPPEARR